MPISVSTFQRMEMKKKRLKIERRDRREPRSRARSDWFVNIIFITALGLVQSVQNISKCVFHCTAFSCGKLKLTSTFSAEALESMISSSLASSLLRGEAGGEEGSGEEEEASSWSDPPRWF